jgi:mitochondrial distribution and morphology protein 10
MLIYATIVSTGIRFTTLPDATPPSFQLPSTSALPSNQSPLPLSQPPTTLTALFNPMLGHISGAYAARVSRDLSMCSRFDFNVYSYESEWTMGAEWWIRKNGVKHAAADASVPLSLDAPSLSDDAVHGVVKARASTSNVGFPYASSLDSSPNVSLQDVSIMWEGRIHNLMVSLGVVSNLSGKGKPIKAMGLELSYFSSE